MTTNVSTIQSFSDFAARNWTDVVSATFEGVSAGNLTVAQREAMLAQALERQATDLMREAARYGQQADALGDAAANLEALHILTLRSEILMDIASPDADREKRMEYAVSRLQAGQRETRQRSPQLAEELWSEEKSADSPHRTD